MPLSNRKGLQKFRAAVLDHCFHRSILTTQLLRNNARQARGYIVAYLMMHSAVAAKQRQEREGQQQDTNGDEDLMEEATVTLEALKDTVAHIACKRIKQARKSYKRHRGIALFDCSNATITFQMTKKEYRTMPTKKL